MTAVAVPGPHPGSGSAVEPVAGDRRRQGSGDDWRRAYSRRLWCTDLVVLAAVVATGWAVPPILDGGAFSGGESARRVLWSAALAIGWGLLLHSAHTRAGGVVGAGTEEYRRILDTAVWVFGLAAVIALTVAEPTSTVAILVSVPFGLVALFLGRWGWRRWLGLQRRAGRCITPVVVLGDATAGAELAAVLERDRGCGYRVVGVCVPRGAPIPGGEVPVPQPPVLGDHGCLEAALTSAGADTVVVTATERLGHEGLRELNWRLAGMGVAMVVCPMVTDLADRRLTVTAAAVATPWLRVSRPSYPRATRLGKTLLDRIGAGLGLLVLTPLLIICAVVVAVSSRGPVFYVAERIGVHGRPFRMLKFRSMVDGADRQRARYADEHDGAGPLFKMRCDPRVTRVGAVLRRYSLDELPQLVNVVRGEMSLVGPRPPLAEEVVAYDEAVHRRFLVKPGLTGLWQVSGRSDLSWEESVRLDLSYVANWSLAGDLVIIVRTIRAVLRPAGAY